MTDQGVGAIGHEPLDGSRVQNPMRALIAIQRYPVLVAGLVIAATCGVALGAAVHPELSGPGSGGPRMLIPYGGARSETAAAGGGWSGSSQVAPDYVLGTDWTRRNAGAEPIAETEFLDEAETMPTDAATAARPYVSEVRTWDDDVPPPLYPSMVGNAAYADDAADASRDKGPALED